MGAPRKKSLKSFGCVNNIFCEITTGIGIAIHLTLNVVSKVDSIKLMIRFMNVDILEDKVDAKESMGYGYLA